jgi:hypothetical protein
VMKNRTLEKFSSELKPLPSGAIPLYSNCFFPWDGLPYPQQHAELGLLLLQHQETEFQNLALRMACFQEATLDHFKNPIFPFFQQEGKGDAAALQKENTAFFKALGHTPRETFHFVDDILGLFAQRSETSTLVCAGSGCKSGMGYYVYKNAGVMNFGPQLLPLGNCSGFGLAGRSRNARINFREDAFMLYYCCRLAAPHSRATGLDFLDDSGYSGLWIEAEIQGNLNGFSFECHFKGTNPLGRLIFSFFGKGESCIVGNSIKLQPSSLDRYHGPPQRVTFLGQGGGVRVEAQEGLTNMEIIPLAGDRNFWGADFLVGYALALPVATFNLKAVPSN